jgi:hypothetical protein
VPVDEEGLLVGASEQLPHEGGRQLQQRTVRQRLPHTIITPHYKCELYWRAQNRIGITEKMQPFLGENSLVEKLYVLWHSRGRTRLDSHDETKSEKVFPKI